MDLDFSKITDLFLDLDGTLINSLPRLKYVYHDFLNEHDLRGSEEEFKNLKTISMDQLIEHFRGKYTLSYPTVMLKKKYEQYLEKYYFSAPLFHGVRTFLKKAKQKGLRIFLTTANQKAFAEKILSKHKIDSLFDSILTPSCFGFGSKETPFYEKVIEVSEVNPSQVLVIDDSIEVIACASSLKLNTFLFSKINYHPIPCFGSWRSLNRQWFHYAPT